MSEACDVAIIGGGAAGLTTAIFAAQTARERSSPCRIIVLDGAKKIGAKILVSGGGRCNVTHEHVSPEDYQGPRTVIRNVLRGFDEAATVAWMRSLGVELKCEETGKLFPTSDDAHTVLGALLGRCGDLGVEIRADHRVVGVERRDGGFLLADARGELTASRVVLATGGRSLPRTGSDGFGYELAKRLGHTVTPTYAALVPLVLADGFFHGELSGISHEAELTTLSDGRPVDRRRGSLLWTHFGISGPLAMDASRFWVIARAQGNAAELRCTFLPGESFEAVERWLIAETSASPRKGVANLLAERLPQRVAHAVAKHAGVDSVPLGRLGRDARRSLVHALTAMPLPVVRDRGWNYAEVTAGGVPMNEVDYRTMQSRRTPGLYLVGEILDVEGRIGGFNFQWAWSTGHAAGLAVT